MTNKNFDTNNNFLTFQVDMLDNLKKLKSVRTKSTYIDFISRWYVDSNLFLDGSDYRNNLYLSKYTDLITVFSKLVVIPQSFIDEYNVKPYHIQLIRSLYFQIDIDEYDNGNENFSMSIGYKKPYGNSNILSDVSNAYLDYDKSQFTEWAKKQNLEDGDVLDELLDDWQDIECDFLLSIHMKTLEIFDNMLKKLSLRCLKFEAIGFNNWTETTDGLIDFIKASRLKKLKKIVE